MTTQPEMHTEGQREFWKLWKSYRRSAWNNVVLLIAVVSLVFGVVSQRTGNEAKAQAQAQCQLDKSIAEAPAGKSPSPLGLHILAGSRIAYIKARCDLGPLVAPDPRVVPYLPKGLK